MPTLALSRLVFPRDFSIDPDLIELLRLPWQKYLHSEGCCGPAFDHTDSSAQSGRALLTVPVTLSGSPNADELRYNKSFVV